MNEVLEHFPQEYVDGYVEFFYQKFFVNEHVLIPRYETETLVRKAISICKENNIDTIVDIGTGSGIIPISIASNVPHQDVFATDISADALTVAQKNSDNLIGGKLQTLRGDLLKPIVTHGRILTRNAPILITANLPYVGTWEKDAMSEDTIHEPDIALFGDSPDGFDLYRRFLRQLSEVQTPFICLIEFGMWQRDIADEEIAQHGWEYSFFADERGIERFALIKSLPL